MHVKLTSCSVVLIIATLFIQNSIQLNNNIIKEENNVQQVAGNKNALKNLKISSSMNSNKEFVFGDDDDQDDKLDQTETPKSDSNMLNSNPFETEMINDDDSDSDEVEDIFSELKRNQRVDVKHPLHEKHLPNLLKFHKMADLQRKLLELSDNKHNFDYDILIDDDFFEKSKKLLKSSEKKAESIETSIESEEEPNREQGDTITIEDLLNQLENKLKSPEKAKFLKPSLQVKEQIYLEGVYNKLQKQSKPNAKNSFFNPENEPLVDKAFSMSDDGQVDPALMPENLTSSHVQSNPSLKMRTENTHSGVDSKFEMIKRQNDYLFLFVVAGCTLAGILALLAASVCWYTVAKSRRTSKSNLEFESSKHSIFGNQTTGSSSVSGSIKSKSSNSSGDKKLALSAQMYHYQHQKEQMIAMEKANNETKPDNSDNSDDETPEGDYTVYECPGLAPTGEMEVKNPLFKEDFSASSNTLNRIQPPPSYSTVALNNTTNIVNETIQNEKNKTVEQPAVEISDQNSKL